MNSRPHDYEGWTGTLLMLNVVETSPGPWLESVIPEFGFFLLIFDFPHQSFVRFLRQEGSQEESLGRHNRESVAVIS